ncbi:hypothetical protein OSTOST_25409 [Ostertagia ostertagi]
MDLNAELQIKTETVQSVGSKSSVPPSFHYGRNSRDCIEMLNPLQCDFMPPQPGPFGQQPNPFSPQAALFYGQQPQFSQAATDTPRGSH